MLYEVITPHLQYQHACWCKSGCRDGKLRRCSVLGSLFNIDILSGTGVFSGSDVTFPILEIDPGSPTSCFQHIEFRGGYADLHGNCRKEIGCQILHRITSYNVCYTKLLRATLKVACSSCTAFCGMSTARFRTSAAARTLAKSPGRRVLSGLGKLASS